MSALGPEHNTPALAMILGLVATVAILLAAASCASQASMIRAERGLEAGSEKWDLILDDRIADCEEQQLQSDSAKDICIAPTVEANEAVEVGVVAAVAALRAYWLGIAVGESPKELARHAAAFWAAVSTLPPEAFGGLRGAR